MGGTPAIPIKYWGTKTEGIFEMLGLSELVVDKRSLNAAKLFDLVNLIEENYDTYLDTIDKRMGSCEMGPFLLQNDASSIKDALSGSLK